MMLSGIIISIFFILMIIGIMSGKINKAIIALAAALGAYFVLTFIENAEFGQIISFIVGSSADGFVNFRALILILGMLFIVQVCHSGGVFQFFAFKLIQMTKGNPLSLLFMLCSFTVLLSAILNNILTVIILIPLTITVSRILGIDPSPYILSEAILVNVGGILFSISSIPNILISTYANISFLEFFLQIGSFALIILIITMIFFYFYFSKQLFYPQEKFKRVLQDFNIWNYVPNRPLFYKAFLVLIMVMVSFAIIPSAVISPDIIALSGAILLIIISKMNGREIIERIDWELLLYLIGIFVITGALEYVGFLNLIGDGIIAFIGNNPISATILILWVSGLFSSFIDNISITKVLMPVANVISSGFSVSQTKMIYYGLVYGVNLGDNLSPLGDNILVINLAEQHERPIRFSQLFKIGFIATILQLIAITLYFIMFADISLAISILLLIGLIVFLYNFVRTFNQKYKRNKDLLSHRYYHFIKNQFIKQAFLKMKLFMKKFLKHLKRGWLDGSKRS
ncbi:MAG: SLC13 family permease [Candidatus Helarchaeota archaeon]